MRAGPSIRFTISCNDTYFGHVRALPGIRLSQNRSKPYRQNQTTIGSRPTTSIGRPIAWISFTSLPSVAPRSMKTT